MGAYKALLRRPSCHLDCFPGHYIPPVAPAPLFLHPDCACQSCTYFSPSGAKRRWQDFSCLSTAKTIRESRRMGPVRYPYIPSILQCQLTFACLGSLGIEQISLRERCLPQTQTTDSICHDRYTWAWKTEDRASFVPDTKSCIAWDYFRC